MTLLSICQDAAREVGTYVPGVIIGNTDETAVRLRALADRQGKALSRRHNWQALSKVHTFSTSDGTAAYSLPSDFRFLINGTWWDRGDQDLLWGPATPQLWQDLKSGTVTATVQPYFRVIGDQLELHPVPSSSFTVAFEYISSSWVDTDGDGTGDANAFQADGDTAVLDEDIITLGVVWRLLNAEGLPYAEQFNEYERLVEQAIARDGGADWLTLGGRGGSRDLRNLPEQDFGL